VETIAEEQSGLAFCSQAAVRTKQTAEEEQRERIILPALFS
jgi:hypothetical protein